WCVSLYFFFFFQAEDGIRDFHVTGVQTCALPILQKSASLLQRPRSPPCSSVGMRRFKPVIPNRLSRIMQLARFFFPPCPVKTVRSEERRVGKECRSGWARDREREKEMKV